jgi:hypothetical protein
MEDKRGYRNDDDDWTIPDDERDYDLAPDEELPFHIPRD